jgi:RNA polymerase sigma factor (sigma-70 family)
MQPRLLKHPARLAGASLLRLQDDNRLVALAREGHDPAFAAIVDRYRAQLERYCARLLNDTHPARAEDAVQQAFVNAHAAMKTTDQELVLKPWLYRIAHNAALNILRASKGEDTAVLDLEHAGAVQTADVVLLREQLRETLASIQALPAAQRDALLLREIEGRSHEEIALALGVSAGGARQHLHRARMSLRAAASAITPYPILSRILNAAADEGGRSADLVSGAGMGLGAGGVKAASAVLAAGALAGGAVGVHHHHRAHAGASAAQAQHVVVKHAAPAVAVAVAAVAVRHTTTHTTTASTHHAARTHEFVSFGRGSGHRAPASELHRSGSSHDDGTEVEHHGGSTPTKSTEDHSGTGGGTDDHLTTTATSDDNSGPGSMSDGSVTSGSGSGDGMTQTTTSMTDDRSGSSGSGSGTSTSGSDGGSDDPTTTDGH